MSFHEKSAWACLSSLVAVFVPYFFYVFQYPMAFIGLFVIAVIVLIALLVGFHGINALWSPNIRAAGGTPKLDERDKLIETTAAKVSGIVLGILVMLWCLNAMFGIPVAATLNVSESASNTTVATMSHFAIPAVQALAWVHALFAAFVVANLIYYSTIIYSYRRSA